MIMLTQQNLSLVVEGMEVYDWDGALIGIVKTFRPGEGVMGSAATDVDTMVKAVSDTLDVSKELPNILYARLFEEGFVCVRRSLFRKDVIVFPSQIEDIGDYAIHLKVNKNQLTRI
jgi:hypothetical protein